MKTSLLLFTAFILMIISAGTGAAIGHIVIAFGNTTTDSTPGLDVAILYYGDDMSTEQLDEFSTYLKDEFDRELDGIAHMNTVVKGVFPLPPEDTDYMEEIHDYSVIGNDFPWIPEPYWDRFWYYYHTGQTEKEARELARKYVGIDYDVALIITEAQFEGIGKFISGDPGVAIVENPIEGGWANGAYFLKCIKGVSFLVDESMHEIGHFYGAEHLGSQPDNCEGYETCIMSYCRTRPTYCWNDDPKNDFSNEYCTETLETIQGYYFLKGG